MSCDVIIISGPTATGKSFAAEQVSEFVNSVVINADSQQVYKEIPVITDQPPYSINNRMYGYVSVTKKYSLGFWIDDVVFNIKSAWKENKIPIVVGGTYMYIDVLLNGISYIPKLDNFFYDKYLELFNSFGLNKFKNKFLPHSKYNDAMRLCKSAALLEQTGKSLECWHKVRNSVLPNVNKLICCSLLKSKAFIYQAIEERYKFSFNNGIIEEALRIIDMGVDKKVSGLSPVIKYVKGELCIDKAIDEGQREIKNYAKRQITWFKNSAGKEWNFFENTKDLVSFVKDTLISH